MAIVAARSEPQHEANNQWSCLADSLKGNHFAPFLDLVIWHGFPGEGRVREACYEIDLYGSEASECGRYRPYDD
jgi:hypothetical protein